MNHQSDTSGTAPTVCAWRKGCLLLPCSCHRCSVVVAAASLILLDHTARFHSVPSSRPLAVRARNDRNFRRRERDIPRLSLQIQDECQEPRQFSVVSLAPRLDASYCDHSLMPPSMTLRGDYSRGLRSLALVGRMLSYVLI